MNNNVIAALSKCKKLHYKLKSKIVNVDKLYKIQSKNKYNLINILSYILYVVWNSRKRKIKLHYLLY